MTSLNYIVRTGEKPSSEQRSVTGNTEVSLLPTFSRIFWDHSSVNKQSMKLCICQLYNNRWNCSTLMISTTQYIKYINFQVSEFIYSAYGFVTTCLNICILSYIYVYYNMIFIICYGWTFVNSLWKYYLEK